MENKTVLQQLVEFFNKQVEHATETRDNQFVEFTSDWNTSTMLIAYGKTVADMLTEKLPAERRQMEDAWNDGMGYAASVATSKGKVPSKTAQTYFTSQYKQDEK